MEPIISLYSHRNTDQWVALTMISSKDRATLEDNFIRIWEKEKERSNSSHFIAWLFRADEIRSTNRAFQLLQRTCFHVLHQAGWIPFVMNEEKTDSTELSKYDLRITAEHYEQNDTDEAPEAYLTSLNEIIRSDWIEGRGDAYRQGYVCIFSIKQQTSCGITYYPNFIDESEITSALTNLFFQCSIPHKELEIPLKQGHLLLMSGATYWKRNYPKGKENAYTVTIHVLERE